MSEPGRIIYQPGSAETNEEEKEEEEEETEENEGVESGPHTQQPDLRRSSRTPVPRQVLNLHTTEQAYERIDYSLMTGSELGNIATGRPGEVGYMPSDPANYNEEVSGPDAERWKENMRDEAQTLIDHDVFDWVAPPEGVNSD